MSSLVSRVFILLVLLLVPMMAKTMNGQVKIMVNKNETPCLRSQSSERKTEQMYIERRCEKIHSHTKKWRNCKLTLTLWSQLLAINPFIFSILQYIPILLKLIGMGTYDFVIKLSMIIILY